MFSRYESSIWEMCSSRSICFILWEKPHSEPRECIETSEVFAVHNRIMQTISYFIITKLELMPNIVAAVAFSS